MSLDVVSKFANYIYLSIEPMLCHFKVGTNKLWG